MLGLRVSLLELRERFLGLRLLKFTLGQSVLELHGPVCSNQYGQINIHQTGPAILKVIVKATNKDKGFDGAIECVFEELLQSGTCVAAQILFQSRHSLLVGETAQSCHQDIGHVHPIVNCLFVIDLEIGYKCLLLQHSMLFLFLNHHRLFLFLGKLELIPVVVQSFLVGHFFHGGILCQTIRHKDLVKRTQERVFALLLKHFLFTYQRIFFPRTYHKK